MNKTWVSSFGLIMLMVTGVAWTAPVPDTGQQKGYDIVEDMINSCPLSGRNLYSQSDTYIVKTTSYTKLDGGGKPLPDSATSWNMVKDNVTGLIWEMKTNKDGVINYNNPNDADNTYSWSDKDSATPGGYEGTPDKVKDTQDFINDLNSANFGGYSDWRLPTLKELSSIVNYDIPSPGPTINTTYFPNTQSSFYWTSTPSPGYDYRAWVVGFDDSNSHNYGKYRQCYVRAVRGRLEIRPPQQRYWDNSSAPYMEDRLSARRATGYGFGPLFWPVYPESSIELSGALRYDWRSVFFLPLQAIDRFSHGSLPTPRSTYSALYHRRLVKHLRHPARSDRLSLANIERIWL